MNFITEKECSDWLERNEILRAPYRRKPLPDKLQWIQFAPRARSDSEIVEDLVATAGNFEGCLVKIEDWNWDSEYEGDPTAALRAAHGEERSLIEVPGFVFQREDLEAAEDLCRTILSRGWTAYLYFLSRSATILFWEGDLIDFWTADADTLHRVEQMILTKSLRRT
jgi:hypothetical protein